jgi:dTDP-4-amino-4,6-dideoxygalactose transaminase
MKVDIPFNKAPLVGNEEEFVLQSMQSNKMSGNGPFGDKCQNWFSEKLGCSLTLLTPSCTAALEMAAILIDVKLGDEIIMPSYTFVSTANAFVLRGAKIVFVDIRPDTMNIDENKIEAAITSKTKAIVPVHYAGVGCEMDVIMDIANRHSLFVIEDAAQGMMATYKNRPLGSIGHLGAYSFHETKNYTSAGEGGLLIINDDKFSDRAEIIREKGTNRNLFFRGQVDKYSWVDVGSSYLTSDVQAAYLWGQLGESLEINTNRLQTWNRYFEGLSYLNDKGVVELPNVPHYCEHNAHMFYLKFECLKVRTDFIDFLKKRSIVSAFHYVPLHSSIAGKKYGIFHDEDVNTTVHSEKLARLPMWYGMTEKEVDSVIEAVNEFFE